MKQAVCEAQGAAKPIGPYSLGVKFGGLFFVSGQTPIRPADGTVPQGIEAQTRQALANVLVILESQGLDFSDVLKTTVFLKDFNQFKAMNAIYAEHFPEPYPARSCVEVARLPLDVLVEIEVVAGLRA